LRVAAYKNLEPTPHWHFVSINLSGSPDDFENEGFGLGGEVTFRLACRKSAKEAPMWAHELIQKLGRIALDRGRGFSVGTYLNLLGPITGDAEEISLVGLGAVADPALAPIETAGGRVEFTQVFGLTEDEILAAVEWGAPNLLALLGEQCPLFLTDVARPSFLDAPANADAVRRGVERDGSPHGRLLLAADDCWEVTGPVKRRAVTISLPEGDLKLLVSMLRGRTLHNRECTLSDGTRKLHLVPAEDTGWSIDDQTLALRLTESVARQMVSDLASPAEVYSWTQLPKLLLKTSRRPDVGA
jgi:hypothetical protein